MKINMNIKSKRENDGTIFEKKSEIQMNILKIEHDTIIYLSDLIYNCIVDIQQEKSFIMKVNIFLEN